MSTLFILLAAVVLVGGTLVRARLRNAPQQDDPLDMDAVREEEERFWSESWDEPEEWRG